MTDDSRTPPLLGPHTTLGLGGPAARLGTARTTEEIIAGVRDCARAGEPLLLLGGGSNVVIADEGFGGLALLLRSTGYLVTKREPEAVQVQVAAGQPWDEFVEAAVEEGWSGVECLSGIPGAAGGTPIQNVGAYGQEVSEVLTEVTVYDRADGRVLVYPADQCRFGYRTSLFKHAERWVVLDVTFRLRLDPLSTPVGYAELARKLDTTPGQRAPLGQVREAVLELRRSKGMVLDPNDPDTRSVGSFFTNPVLTADAYAQLQARLNGQEPPSWPAPNGVVKVSAAWLIEQAGFRRGYHRGPVAISSKHTLALTNPGGGKTADLLALAAEIRDGVLDRFGVVLHPEPVMINCSL